MTWLLMTTAATNAIWVQRALLDKAQRKGKLLCKQIASKEGSTWVTNVHSKNKLPRRPLLSFSISKNQKMRYSVFCNIHQSWSVNINSSINQGMTTASSDTTYRLFILNSNHVWGRNEKKKMCEFDSEKCLLKEGVREKLLCPISRLDAVPGMLEYENTKCNFNIVEYNK